MRKGSALVSLAALVVIVSALAVGVGLVQRKTRVETKAVGESRPVVVFPQDHASHPAFAAEWWYLNMLTRTTKADGSDQRDLAYVLSFSRILGGNNLLSSRYDDSVKTFVENTEQEGSLVVQLLDNSRLLVQFSKDLVLATLEELPMGGDRKRAYHLTGRTASIGSFDLILKERTVVVSGYNTPLLWGGTTGSCLGKISVFSVDDTYYYSVPDLDISGTITEIDGTRRNVVIGKAWIDHQWFSSPPPSDWRGHYWTNFHFTNSNNLYDPGSHQAFAFVTQIYSSGPRYSYWVRRNTDGTNECGTSGSVVVNSYGSSGYPNSWSISANQFNATGYSFSDNQIFQPPTGPKFIEAVSYYSGNANGIPFTGLGFFETHLTFSPTPTPVSPSETPKPTPTRTPTPVPPTPTSATATPTIACPLAPSGLTCSASGSTTVNLNWTDNSNSESNFVVWRDPPGTSPQATLAANSTSFTNTGLTCGTTYQYQIQANNSCGSSVSNVCNVTPPCPTPTPRPITIFRRVAAGSDDAEEYLGSKKVVLGSSDLELGYNRTTPQMVGMRFRNMAIGRGKTITNAYIEFQADEVDTKATWVTFWGHKTGNSARFKTSPGNLSSRVKTAAKVTWNVPQWTRVGTKYRTPNLKAIIQEIVHQSTWVSGNSLVILATGRGERTAESYEGLAAGAAKLVVEYR